MTTATEQALTSDTNPFQGFTLEELGVIALALHERLETMPRESTHLQPATDLISQCFAQIKAKLGK